MRVVTALMLTASVCFANVAPPFQGDTLDGNKVSLRSLVKPGRVLMVSFWATWCGPCLNELKHVSEYLASQPDLPLDVVAVNTDTSETLTDVKPTVKLHKIKFPVVLDTKQEILEKYNTSKVIPFSVLIGPSGNIEATFSGFNEGMFDKIKSVVAANTAKGK
jgi:peroxiredoxin